MKTYFFLTAAFTWLILSSCSKMAEDHALCTAVATGDINTAESWINHMARPLLPEVSENDAYGHEANLSELIELLNEIDCLEATLGCYACIETYPPISELVVRSDDVERVIFLRTSHKHAMKFIGWRE